MNPIQVIQSEIEELGDFDQLQVHIKKHLGKISKTEMVKITSVKIDGNEPNVIATTIIFNLIKALQLSQDSGQLTFTLKFNKGFVTNLSTQDFKETKY